MGSNREFLNNLQALRAYAAATVVFVHLSQVYRSAAPFGLYGVDIFFVLSGFIMAMLSTREQADFLTRRLIRIVPLYWICTIGVFSVAWVWPELLHSTRTDWGNLFKSLFFIPYRKESGAVQPLLFLGWTLNYEVFFYFIFGVVLRLRLPRPSMWVSLLILSLPVLGMLFHPGSLPWAFYLDPIVLDFLLGIGVYHLTLTACSLLLLPVMEMTFGVAHRQILLGLPAAALVFCAVRLERAEYVVRNKFVLLIGNASYVLYLTHPYVLQFGEKVLRMDSVRSVPERVVLGALLIVPAVLVACVIHVYIEMPVMAFLKRWLLSRPGQKIPVGASPIPTAPS
jgi:exopolysaccharide production protein ExoZ